MDESKEIENDQFDEETVKNSLESLFNISNDEEKEIYNSILNFIIESSKNKGNDTTNDEFAFSCHLFEKEWRTKFHQFIRIFVPHLHSETKIDTSKIHLFKPSSSSSNRRDRNKKRGWPSNRPKYLRFVLYKENKDTTEALKVLSQLLKVKPNLFTFGGTKDKRGITSQYVTVSKVEASKMASLNPKLFGIKVGNFKYVDSPLKFGDLKGNKFTILLRNVKPLSKMIKACDSIKERGFINYYGMQRFGTSSVPTHYIGKLCILEKWKDVVMSILRPREGEPKASYNARKYFIDTGDVKGTLKKLPKQLHIEKYILEGLDKHGHTNYLGSFQYLPKQMKYMYVHAYQSYVWNEAVSKRIELYGSDKLVIGDLVKLGEFNGEISYNENIKIIESEEECNQYSIYDLVLPLPGSEIIYPKNKVNDHYVEIMKKDNIDPYSLSTQEFYLPGSYREVFNHPNDFSYEIIKYNDENQDLNTSDLDLLNIPKHRTNQNENQKNPSDENGEEKTAVRIKFSLSTSSYATMLLRELLHCPFDILNIKGSPIAE